MGGTALGVSSSPVMSGAILDGAQAWEPRARASQKVCLLSLDKTGGDADLLRSLCRTASVFRDLFAPFSLNWGFSFPIRGMVMTP